MPGLIRCFSSLSDRREVSLLEDRPTENPSTGQKNSSATNCCDVAGPIHGLISTGPGGQFPGFAVSSAVLKGGTSHMILDRLKSETRDLHERTERVVDLSQRLRSLVDYRQLLIEFYGLYGPLERRLQAVRGMWWDGFRFADRRKTPQLRTDLRVLGCDDQAIAAIPCCDAIPSIGEVARAAGCLYVLEGATLGGQIIRAESERRLAVGAANGGLFFAGYGDRTREMWQTFCSTLTAFVASEPAVQDLVVAAAQETFRCFEAWLSRDFACRTNDNNS